VITVPFVDLQAQQENLAAPLNRRDSLALADFAFKPTTAKFRQLSQQDNDKGSKE